MNKPVKSSAPRRTTTKEATERSQPAPREYQKEINVMAILADPYPRNGEDYAMQLFYRSKQNRRNPFFTCHEKRLDNDNETAHLMINGSKYQINIRTGSIFTE